METKKADLSALKINRSESPSELYRKRKITRIAVTVIILVLAAVILSYSYTSIFSAGIDVTLTRASLVSTSQSNAVLTASGYVVAQRKASVASKQTGRLVYLGVVEGDAVKKDQVIARLEDNDLQAQLEQAKANLKLYEADLKLLKGNYEREKTLYESGLSTKVELENAEAGYQRILASIDLAKAQILAAEIAIENTLIKAPFNGTVLTKNADVGEIVSPLGASSTSRAAVVTMADMSSLQVEADVSESNIEKILINQNCEITLDAYPGTKYPGYVAKIVPTADRSKATVLVKVAFRDYDEKVLPEMSAKVLFLSKDINQSNNQNEEIVNEKPMLVIPKTALLEKNDKKIVYKVNDDYAVEINVETGRDAGNYTEITAGLQNGDRIINNIPGNIKDGTKVNIKNN